MQIDARVMLINMYPSGQVVGDGEVLSGAGMGDMIDSHAAVIRVGNTPAEPGRPEIETKPCLHVQVALPTSAS